MKLIVFDLDGTLLNTLQDLTDSVNYAMAELNLNHYTCEQVRMMIGNGVAKLMERAVAKQSHIELKDEALRLQRLYYIKHSDDHTVPYNGITEMLRELKRSGITVAVHTNKDENAAKSLCEKHFAGLIDYVCGTTGDGVTKPDPIKIKCLMSKLGVKADETVYCGDSDVDIATANNLGVRCISVLWGFRDESFLTTHGAKIFAENPRDIVTVVSKTK